MMVHCPACGARSELRRLRQTKTVVCPDCDRPFTVGVTVTAGGRDAPALPAGPSPTPPPVKIPSVPPPEVVDWRDAPPPAAGPDYAPVPYRPPPVYYPDPPRQSIGPYLAVTVLALAMTVFVVFVWANRPDGKAGKAAPRRPAATVSTWR